MSRCVAGRCRRTRSRPAARLVAHHGRAAGDLDVGDLAERDERLTGRPPLRGAPASRPGPIGAQRGPAPPGMARQPCRRDGMSVIGPVAGSRGPRRARAAARPAPPPMPVHVLGEEDRMRPARGALRRGAAARSARDGSLGCPASPPGPRRRRRRRRTHPDRDQHAPERCRGRCGRSCGVAHVDREAVASLDGRADRRAADGRSR